VYFLEKIKQRWRDFYNVHSDMKHLYIIDFCDGDVGGAWPNPDKKQERIDWSIKLYEYEMEQKNWLSDDKMPYLRNTTGTEIFAEAFGCSVCRPKNDMPFAVPMIREAKDIAKLKVPSIYDGSLSTIFEIADKTRSVCGKDALMGLPDIQSPMDIAALIWNKEDLFLAMYDELSAVKELAGMVNELLRAFLDEWFRRYGTEYIAHFPRYYMEGGLTLSEDEIGVVSREMFDEFFRDHLNNLSDRYGGIGIHCCANARHQWENLSQIQGVKMLNLVENADETFDFFDKKCALWSYWCPDAQTPAWQYIDLCPNKNAHNVFFANPSTRDEALQLAEKYALACGH
jgi:hypothetical protein